MNHWEHLDEDLLVSAMLEYEPPLLDNPSDVCDVVHIFLNLKDKMVSVANQILLFNRMFEFLELNFWFIVRYKKFRNATLYKIDEFRDIYINRGFDFSIYKRMYKKILEFDLRYICN